ncbi:MAG: hypothetical protein JST28_17085 [Acidobacteria bacterium]|nr:hypothetical protein [Acidobacteriota bacterium]
MEYLIGIVLALAVCIFAMLTGFDRGRVFYSTVVIIVAHYYILFATMGATKSVLFEECAAATIFIVLAVIGFKTSFWIVAAALAGHGIFDFFHHKLIQNPGVPAWWPSFCMSFDVFAGAFVAILLMRRGAAAQ